MHRVFEAPLSGVEELFALVVHLVFAVVRWMWAEDGLQVAWAGRHGRVGGSVGGGQHGWRCLAG